MNAEILMLSKLGKEPLDPFVIKKRIPNLMYFLSKGFVSVILVSINTLLKWH